MKKIFQEKVPLWVAIAVIVAVFAFATIVVFVIFRDATYNYHISLPQSEGAVPFVYGSQPALANADFYDRTRASLIAQKVMFIEANLSSMQLNYYVKGAVALTVPILAKGRVGSWWETPAGLYKVQAKVPSDFSSFAHVYSPWALAFEGNFLIHGWPYYPDGTPVGSTYSGGCIRLSTPDAKKLYDMVSVGTPVLVSSDNFTSDNFVEKQPGPAITATSFLAADLKGNYVFAQKDPDKQVSIASITKLMTALVAVEHVNIEKTITVTPDMIVKTSVPRLRVGQSYSLYNLLQPLLKESSNESAMAISDFLGTQYFVSLMNQQAVSIGMTDTHFVDPSGSGWGNVSTAHDLFMLAQYLYNNRSFILMMSTDKNDPNAYGPGVFAGLQNFNVFADDPNFVGGKVGLNGATSGTIISVFNEPFGNDLSVGVASGTDAASTSTATNTLTRPIVLIVLDSNNYTQDAQTFLSWIKSGYQ